MKIVSVLRNAYTKKSKNITKDLYKVNLVRKSIEKICDKYLVNTRDILEFEALPEVINETLDVLASDTFQEKYEFEQINSTCFRIKLKEIHFIGW